MRRPSRTYGPKGPAARGEHARRWWGVRTAVRPARDVRRRPVRHRTDPTPVVAITADARLPVALRVMDAERVRTPRRRRPRPLRRAAPGRRGGPAPPRPRHPSGGAAAAGRRGVPGRAAAGPGRASQCGGPPDARGGGRRLPRRRRGAGARDRTATDVLGSPATPAEIDAQTATSWWRVALAGLAGNPGGGGLFRSRSPLARRTPPLHCGAVIVYPAVDIRNGRCVQLTQGRPDTEVVHHDDPAAQAALWTSLGAGAIHVVNLDGALAYGAGTASALNLQRVKEIRRTVDVPLQFAGGLRDERDVETAIGLDVDRIVIGTAAVVRPELVGVGTTPVGARTGGGGAGGQGRAGGHARVAAVHAAHARPVRRGAVPDGVRTALYTDVDREGLLGGIDAAGAVALAEATGLRLVISGGVGGIDDIRALAAVGDAVEGVVIGQALYTAGSPSPRPWRRPRPDPRGHPTRGCTTRPASTGRPGPESWPRASPRPAIAISSASPGPLTSVPFPAAQSTSVATRRRPRIRPNAPIGGATRAKSSTGRSRSDRDVAEEPHGPPDVLVVDHTVHQRDPATEPGRQTPRPQVVFEDLDQLLGAVPGVVGHADRVDPAWHEPTAGVAAQEATRVELLVADHVRDDVAHRPLRAQRRRRPLLRGELAQQRRQVRPLGVGKGHEVAGHQAPLGIGAQSVDDAGSPRRDTGGGGRP